LLNRETADAIAQADIKRANKRRKYSDGRGLFLSVSSNGRKTWAYCYKLHGKPREMGLGSIDFIDLEAARTKLMALRDLVRSGVDPLGECEVAEGRWRASSATDRRTLVTAASLERLVATGT
jgi:hypothetical protein